MSIKRNMKPLTMAVSTAIFGSMVAMSSAQAESNPFGMTDLSSGYQVAMGKKDEASEGKCGGDMKGKEGKCGDDMKGKEGKCGGDMKGKEGKCGGDMKDKEGKMKGKEGKCGEGKCGGKK